MRRIFKYVIDTKPGNRDYVDVEMVIGAQILHLGEQNGELVVWVTGNLSDGLEKRRFYILATGEAVPDPNLTRYVGTAIVGPYVWHVYRDVYNGS